MTNSTTTQTATTSYFERLEVKWSVSRGQDTYGYNICRINTRNKSYKTVGGGYDMLGTVLGDYLSDLLTDSEKQAALDANMYGITKREGVFYIDGGCGESCMIKIAKSAGYSIKSVYSYDRQGRVKDTIGFMVSRDAEGAEAVA